MTGSESIVVAVGRFVEHKRAHGRKYHSEEYALRLLVRFCAEQDVHRLCELTPALLDEFLASRPRSRPRSFNHLLGVVRCLLDWAVSQQLLEVSPLRARRRRVTADRIPFIFDPTQARWLLDAAAALPDNSRAPQRGATYRTIFALCYGLGLRAGEVCGLHLGDIDTHRSLLVVRGGKFGKAGWCRTGRGSPRSSASSSSAEPPVARRVRTRRCSPSTAAAVSIRARPARRSIAWSVSLGSKSPTVSRHRCCTACDTASRSAACCAGTGRGSTHPPGCISSRRSWVTSIRSRPRSI